MLRDVQSPLFFLVLTVVGGVGLGLGFAWGRNFLYDQPYSTVAGFLILFCPIMVIVGIIALVGIVRRR
jgi:hypothetical protein